MVRVAATTRAVRGQASAGGRESTVPRTGAAGVAAAGTVRVQGDAWEPGSPDRQRQQPSSAVPPTVAVARGPGGSVVATSSGGAAFGEGESGSMAATTEAVRGHSNVGEHGSADSGTIITGVAAVGTVRAAGYMISVTSASSTSSPGAIARPETWTASVALVARGASGTPSLPVGRRASTSALAGGRGVAGWTTALVVVNPAERPPEEGALKPLHPLVRWKARCSAALHSPSPPKRCGRLPGPKVLGQVGQLSLAVCAAAIAELAATAAAGGVAAAMRVGATTADLAAIAAAYTAATGPAAISGAAATAGCSAAEAVAGCTSSSAARSTAGVAD